MAPVRVVRTLYKTILKLARRFDDNPQAKSVIYRKNLTPSYDCPASAQYTKILEHLLGKDRFIYDHSRKNFPSFVKFTRDEFRFVDHDVNQSDQIEVAFSVIRKFSGVLKCFDDINSASTFSNYGSSQERGTINDFSKLASTKLAVNSFDVKYADDISSGTILLSHPLMYGNMRRAVVLILQHDIKGTYGIIINRQTICKLHRAVKGLSRPILKHFSQHLLSYGGDRRRTQFIHNIPTCGGYSIPNCVDPNKQLFFGGDIESVISHAETDLEWKTNSKKNLMFFVGCHLWSPNQLQNEIRSGYWVPVVTPPDVVFTYVNETLQEMQDQMLKVVTSVHNDDEISVEIRGNIDEEIGSGSEEMQTRHSSIREKSLDRASNASEIDTEDDEDVDSVVSVNADGSEDLDELDDEDEDMWDGRFEEGSAVELWRQLLVSLGDEQGDLANLPSHIDMTNVSAVDWK